MSKSVFLSRLEGLDPHERVILALAWAYGLEATSLARENVLARLRSRLADAALKLCMPGDPDEDPAEILPELFHD